LQKKSTFHTDALEAIAVCLQSEKERTEKKILEPSHLEKILTLLSNTPEHQLSYFLDSTLKILCASSLVNQKLGNQEYGIAFVGIVKQKLTHPDPHIRVILLSILDSLVDNYHDSTHFLKNNGLLKAVALMATEDISNLVRNMAVKLMSEGGGE